MCCVTCCTDLVCYVVYNDDPIGPSVVTGCDCSESLLSSCVPLHACVYVRVSYSFTIKVSQRVQYSSIKQSTHWPLEQTNTRVGHSIKTHNLKLDGFTVQFHRPDFLQRIIQHEDILDCHPLLWTCTAF